MNEPKRPSSNIRRVRLRESWTIRDVVENFSGKSYEEVKREQEEKRKEK